MSARQQYAAGRASALPVSLLAQAVPMLSRNELAALTERLLERLDELDGDCDLEDSYDQEWIDEREEDHSDNGCGFWEMDQRLIVCDPSLAQNRLNTEVFMPSL